MTRRAICIGCLGLATMGTNVTAQTWEPAPPLPTGGAARIYAAGVNNQGIIYAIGGTPWQNGGDMDGSVHRLPAGAAAWEVVSPLSGLGPVVGQAAGVDSLGRIVIYGGFVLNDGGPGEDTTYEPIDGPSGNIASRNAPENSIGYMAWAADGQGRLYGFGGGPGAGGPNSGYADRYDAGVDSWTQLATMPNPVADACAAYDGAGAILVCGGINAAGTSRIANVARYDIATNTWSDTSIPDLPVALSGARAARGIDGRIYVAGGETGAFASGVTQSAVYKWEPSTNVWSAVSSMATPRRQFGFVLGSDDYLYAIGGANNSGGTNQVEKFFTARCPFIDVQPHDQTGWSGSIAGFSVSASGAEPFSYQWRRNGLSLTDGPTGTGSTINGAMTASLIIHSPGMDDEDDYDVVVSNSCGDTPSMPASLTIRQTPTIPSQWAVVNLHPGWAQLSSYAYGVSNGRVGGEAVTPTILPDGRTLDLAHPVIWNDLQSPGVDVTPGGSVGGGIRDVCGELLVGWYWHTYSCYAGGQWWTCAWQSAAYWSGQELTFTEALHSSGPEYDIASGTDGQHVVGTLTYEYTEGNYTSYATMWTPPGAGLNLHPSGPSNSFANAVDGDVQYGSFYGPFPGPSTRAAMWRGSAASFADIHPDGFVRSWVTGAADGQAVGTAVLGSTNHAMMWVGGAEATIDLTPPDQSGEARDAHGGLQVGTVAGRAAIWAGTPESYFDLSSVLPADYSVGVADAIEVTSDGTILVAGYAYVPARGRYEAIVWRSTPSIGLTGDVNCDGVVDATDAQALADVLVGLDTDPCHIAQADVSGNSTVDGEDIAPFVGAVFNP